MLGCLCYPFFRPFNDHKLQFRSSLCTFLGYTSRHKGYKCLDANGRLFISRHINFNETIFPYALHKPSVSPLSNSLVIIALPVVYPTPSVPIPINSSSDMPFFPLVSQGLFSILFYSMTLSFSSPSSSSQPVICNFHNYNTALFSSVLDLSN